MVEAVEYQNLVHRPILYDPLQGWLELREMEQKRASVKRIRFDTCQNVIWFIYSQGR